MPADVRKLGFRRVRYTASAMRTLYVALAVATAALVQIADPAAQRGPRGLTVEQLIDIRHPSNAVWSPDGRRVAFLSERAGIGNVFVADLDGGTVAMNRAAERTRFVDGVSGALFWSADSARIYFTRQGDLWNVPASGGEAAAVWQTVEAESNVTPSPDGKRVAFVRGNSLYARSLSDGSEAVVFRGDKAVGGVNWSPDGARLLFNYGAETIRHEQTPEYSGAKIIYTISERRPGESLVVPASGGAAVTLPRIGGAGPRGWIDATHVLVDRQSSDFKRRAIVVADVAGGEPKMLYEDIDEKFWSIPGQAEPGAQPSPDGKWIAFVSDRDGWDHLYVMPASGGRATPITRGKFEAWRPAWSRDSTRIAFDANEADHPGDRYIGVATIGRDLANVTVTMLATGGGTSTSPTWSPDGTRILYQHTDARNSADLWIADAPKPGASATASSARRISESMPAGIDKSIFV